MVSNRHTLDSTPPSRRLLRDTQIGSYRSTLPLHVSWFGSDGGFRSPWSSRSISQPRWARVRHGARLTENLPNEPAYQGPRLELNVRHPSSPSGHLPAFVRYRASQSEACSAAHPASCDVRHRECIICAFHRRCCSAAHFHSSCDHAVESSSRADVGPRRIPRLAPARPFTDGPRRCCGGQRL